MTDVAPVSGQFGGMRPRFGLGQADMFKSLSKQQMAVMDRLACGLSNKEIANSLSVSCSTIKSHVLAIYQKTGVSNRVQIALQWLKYRGVIVEIEMPQTLSSRPLQSD
jgi:DNA-binding NarL/FixJ family response regulator